MGAERLAVFMAHSGGSIGPIEEAAMAVSGYQVAPNGMTVCLSHLHEYPVWEAWLLTNSNQRICARCGNCQYIFGMAVPE